MSHNKVEMIQSEGRKRIAMLRCLKSWHGQAHQPRRIIDFIVNVALGPVCAMRLCVHRTPWHGLCGLHIFNTHTKSRISSFTTEKMRRWSEKKELNNFLNCCHSGASLFLCPRSSMNGKNRHAKERF